MDMIEYHQCLVECLVNDGHSHDEILFRMHPAADIIPPDKMFPVELRDSNIHGQGLFATHDIQKGQFITQYPCHLIAHTSKDGSGSMCTTINGTTRKFDPKYAHIVYETPKAHVYIYGDPSIPFQRSACAHYINDSYPNVDELKINQLEYQLSKNKIEYIGKKSFEYDLRVIACKNCALVCGTYYVYAIATRNIKKGDEILASYGFSYWSEHPLAETLEYINTLNPTQRNIWKNAQG